MPVLDSKQANYVSRLIEATDIFMNAYERLQDLRAEYDALDYGNRLATAGFVGENEHVELADVVALINSQTAIETTLAAGHRTNMLKMKR